MMKAIKLLKDDIHLGDIGAIIQNHVEAEGFFCCSRFLWSWYWTIVSSRT